MIIIILMNYFKKYSNYKKQKLDFTHYFCLPLKEEIFVNEYKKFKDNIISKNVQNILPDLFQREDKLHFTLFLISAEDKDERLKLILQKLNECGEEIKKITNGQPLKIKFEGFEAMMDGNYEKTRVIYAKPIKDENFEKINLINDFIIKALVKDKLISLEELNNSKVVYDKEKDKYSNLIHLTVLNNTFLKKSKDKNFKYQKFFNSVSFMKEINGISFVDTNISSILLSKLRTENGNPYNLVHEIKI
jgi:hypothetical protein